ncbi:MAG: 3-hydroxyacyl-CoA dehydrogenase [Burkholderiales bacterium]|nr:3-hydroxyacyl-CoA dehydrogenase [Burkholderiales bacterium]
MAALKSSAAVAVVGAGAMGAGIAQVAAQAGHPVWLFDLKPGAAQQAVEAMRETFAKLAAKGRMSAEAAAAAGARVHVAQGLADFAHAALVVEAIVERLDVKRSLFADLEAIVGDDCVLATNTSSISVTAIAAGLRRPARVLGMHFFNPAPLMALVEVVSGLATDPALAQAIHDTALSWGKSPVHTKSTPGFIVNRVARPYYGEGLRLLGEQAGDAATIDAVMREAGGFRMGPFELMDLIGHDVNYAVSRSVFDAYYGDPRFAPSLIQLELVNAGYLGRKSGRGFYDYAAGAVKPQPATEAAATLAVPISVSTASAFGAALAARLQAADVAFERRDAGPPLQAGAARIEIADGRSATQRGADEGHADLVVVDLVLDAAKAQRIAIAASERCSAAALAAATAALQAAGFAVTRFADVPGLAVMRTVAMLANEAADAVYQGVCDAAAADTAMCKGVNYPRGPLAWADAIGLPALLTVLDNLARTYGEPRYRASPLLRRLVAAGRGFHAPT